MRGFTPPMSLHRMSRGMPVHPKTTPRWRPPRLSVKRWTTPPKAYAATAHATLGGLKVATKSRGRANTGQTHGVDHPDRAKHGLTRNTCHASTT